MSNSKYVDYRRISPNQSGKRKYKITRITPHCIVGQMDVVTLGSLFANSKYQASSNYGIGKDGRVGLYVDESCRSWCSSNADNDNRAVTIECASDAKHPYKFNDTVYKKLVNLCADICKRNGKSKLVWISDRKKALAYKPKDNEMLLTVHRWFAAKACPGDWMMGHMDDLVKKVNKKLGNIYRVYVGKYEYEAQATGVKNALVKDGFKGCFVVADDVFRVQVGAFEKKTNAENLMEKLKKKGYTGYIL